jgi:CheY-like chemotaxis protein
MPKIMIAEDDETMRSLLQTLLEFEGFEVTYVNHLAGINRVIETIREVKPDIILLDVYMNRLDGFELMRRVHQDEALESVRVLLSSGRELSREAMGEGADGFILKPYMPDDLIKQIQNILGN